MPLVTTVLAAEVHPRPAVPTNKVDGALAAFPLAVSAALTASTSLVEPVLVFRDQGGPATKASKALAEATSDLSSLVPVAANA